MKKGIAATFKIKGRKVKIESDGIVNVTLTSGAKFEHIRVTGLSFMGDCLRGVGKDGINEIPIKLIDKVEDAVELENGSSAIKYE